MISSALIFRNVDANVGDPVETWPAEALATAIARGGLSDWRRIVAVIRRDPWGPVARSVEEVLTYERPYGTAKLFESLILRARSAAERQERQAVAEQMRAMVRDSGLTHEQFASRLGTSRTRLSTYLSGRVTPSAALFLRAQRMSVALKKGA